MPSDLCSRLMAISQEALDAGHFDVAYHALAAALHLATEEKDREALRQVEKAATEQLSWIDTHAPDYPHSTASAVKRGHQTIFLQLSRQAHTRQHLLEAEARRDA